MKLFKLRQCAFTLLPAEYGAINLESLDMSGGSIVQAQIAPAWHVHACEQLPQPVESTMHKAKDERCSSSVTLQLVEICSKGGTHGEGEVCIDKLHLYIPKQVLCEA